MKFYYVTEYDSYQRKTRHFFFSDEPTLVSGRWQEKPSYLTNLCPSFVEVEEKTIPAEILQARQTSPSNMALEIECHLTFTHSVKIIDSEKINIPELLIR